MTIARGDSKPCTHVGCTGRMHFRRQAGSELRWVCDAQSNHVDFVDSPLRTGVSSDSVVTGVDG